MTPIHSHKIISNSIWNIIGNLSNIVILFFLYPFLIRHIGDSDYGFFLFLSTVTGIAGVANLGLGEATLRYVAYYHGHDDITGENRVLSSSFWINAALGLAMTLIILCFSGLIITLVKDIKIESTFAVFLLKISAVTFLVRFIGGILFSIPQAYQRYKYTTILTIIEAVLRVTGYVVSIYTNNGIYGMVLTELFLAGFYILSNFMMMKLVNRQLSIFIFPSKQGITELFGYGTYAFLGQLVGLLWQYSDRILLTMFVGTAALSYFVIPQQLIMKIFGIVTAAGAVLFPSFSSINNLSDTKKLFITGTIIFLYASILIFSPLTLLFKDFLSLWISPDFAKNAGHIAFILSLSYIIRGGFIPYDSLFRGLGKPKIIFYITLCSSFVIVILDIILIPLIGLQGAGYAYIISSLIGVGAFLYAWWVVLDDKDTSKLVKFLLIPLLGSYVLTAVLHFILELIIPQLNWMMFGISAILIFSTFSGLLYIYILRMKESAIILSTIKDKILYFIK